MGIVTVLGNSQDISNLVEELKTYNLLANKDYTFSFYKTVYDENWNTVKPMGADFNFHDPKHESWFILKWK